MPDIQTRKKARKAKKKKQKRKDNSRQLTWPSNCLRRNLNRLKEEKKNSVSCRICCWGAAHGYHR